MTKFFLVAFFSLGIISTGSVLGSQATQMVEDHSQRQAAALCEAGLSGACN